MVQTPDSRRMKGLCGETKGRKVRDTCMRGYEGNNDGMIQGKGCRRRGHSELAVILFVCTVIFGFFLDW